jgi:hypothetical protein
MAPMRRGFAVVVLLALVGVPFAAGMIPNCRSMPCCVKQKAGSALRGPACCTAQRCATSRPEAVNLSATRTVHAANLASVSDPAVLPLMANAQCVLVAQVAFSPPASRRLSILSTLLI